jgi:hypothetical protein
MEGLIEYFKETLLSHHLLSTSHKKQTTIYSKSECHRILQFLADVYSTKVIQKQVQLEMVFLRIIQVGKEIAIDELLERLSHLESQTPPTQEKPSQKIYPPEEIKVEEVKIEEKAPEPTLVTEPPPVVIMTEVPQSPPAPLTLSLNEKTRLDNLVRFASVEFKGRVL